MPRSSQKSPTLFAEPELAKRDKDAELKLRVARYLWSLGYVCPTEVAMSGREITQGEAKRYDLTDLDVVGLKFDNDLSWHIVIGDCKTGARTSAVNRLLWLRGIMDLFGAQRGYLAMLSIGRESREVALRLGVSLLDSANLQRYESDKGLSKDGLKLFTIENYDRKRTLWGLSLPKNHKPTEDEERLLRLYQFLSYRYWFQDEYLNVQHTVTAFSDAAAALARSHDELRARVAAYRGLTLFSISVLKMCGSVIATKSDEIHNEVRRYIFGGASNAIERNRLMKLLGAISKTPVSLEPAYYEALLELANRLITFSQYAKSIPRYTELALSETIVGRRPESLETLLGPEFEVDVLKLAKDVAEFFCSASGLDKRYFEALLSQ